MEGKFQLHFGSLIFEARNCYLKITYDSVALHVA